MKFQNSINLKSIISNLKNSRWTFIFYLNLWKKKYKFWENIWVWLQKNYSNYILFFVFLIFKSPTTSPSSLWLLFVFVLFFPFVNKYVGWSVWIFNLFAHACVVLPSWATHKLRLKNFCWIEHFDHGIVSTLILLIFFLFFIFFNLNLCPQFRRAYSSVETGIQLGIQREFVADDIVLV